MAWVLFAQQNTVKTAIRNSRINFYFVTAFYSLYDICMARQMIKNDNRDNRDNRLRLETNTQSQKLSLLSLLSLKKNLVKKDMFFRYEDIKNMLLDKKTCAEWLPNIYRKLNNFKYYAL